jgi:hypothetical protein
MHKMTKNKLRSIGALLSAGLLAGCNTAKAPKVVQKVTDEVFFDDFAYQDMSGFYANDWKVRTQTGHPGISGATWSADGITFHEGIEGAQNGIVSMTSKTGGTGFLSRRTQYWPRWR